MNIIFMESSQSPMVYTVTTHNLKPILLLLHLVHHAFILKHRVTQMHTNMDLLISNAPSVTTVRAP